MKTLKKFFPWTVAIIGGFLVWYFWRMWWSFSFGMTVAEAGQFGDKFGALNTLFTGLALVGLIATFIHERMQVDDAKDDLRQTLDAQRQTTEALRDLTKLGLLQMEVRAREQAAQANSIRAAILAEVRVLWQHYYDDIGFNIERVIESGKVTDRSYVLEGDYYRVFKQCAGQLGLLPDNAERNEIITFYLKAEAQLDRVRQNNQIIARFAGHPQEQQQQLSSYFPSLIRGHREFMQCAKNLLGKIVDERKPSLSLFNDTLKS